MNAPSTSRHARSGFTLIEIMLSMGVMMTVMAMSLGFLLETGRMNFISAEKNDINREVRNVIDRLSAETKQSNLFLIYRSTAVNDRLDSTNRLRTNESGDCLLLVFKSGYEEMLGLGVDPLRDPRPITGLILYYRSETMTENGKSWGPVNRWERDMSSGPITDADQIRDIEQLLPSTAVLNAQSTNVVELSEGLADGRLFYNYKGRTVMINGKIIHGNQAKWVTDTYNFSISPRG